MAFYATTQPGDGKRPGTPLSPVLPLKVQLQSSGRQWATRRARTHPQLVETTTAGCQTATWAPSPLHSWALGGGPRAEHVVVPGASRMCGVNRCGEPGSEVVGERASCYRPELCLLAGVPYFVTDQGSGFAKLSLNLAAILVKLRWGDNL